VASGAQNIGFAIPINDIKGLINSVLSKGQLQQPYLGVRYVSLTNDLASQFNLSITRGAYIVSGDNEPAVIAGSPADIAGLKDGDVITKVNNITIDDKTSLTGALAQFQVGDKVNLTVVRAGKTIQLTATLGNTPTG
jgi:S1-C subfamily serine protease